VLDTLDALRRDTGATVVLVTHDPAVAARADRRVTLRDGRVVPA
jgi:putative ABC transport system ATP-binding protein